MLRIQAAMCLGALILAVGREPRSDVKLRTGDVVFQTSRSAQSAAIQEATGSAWSHVGIIESSSDGVWVVEAAATVKRTPWRTWRRRGQDGRVLVLRPRGLDPAALSRVMEAARAQLGKPYDPQFGWGDDAMYCSELVVKAFERGAGVVVGKRERLGDLRVGNLRRAIERRWHGNVPADLVLVTPASLARDPLFERVALLE